MLPFIGALVVLFSPQRRAAEWGVLFAALTTLCMLSLISAFYQADKVAVTLTLVNVGDVALFGLVIDRVSTLILFVVVFLGLLVTIYSTGYLSDKNREHPHNGTNRYYAFFVVFIGAMAGLVLSLTLLGQLLFFEITGGCSWALISYYQSDKAQRSALKALLITHIGSLGLYLAAATLFLQTGTFALSAMSELTRRRTLSGLWRHPVCRVGEIGPATDASVATGRNGSANTDQRLSPRRIDGESGRLHFCPRHYRRWQYPACDWRRWHGHGPGHHSLWISDVFATAGYEVVAGLVDHHSTWLDVLRFVALHLRLAASAGGQHRLTSSTTCFAKSLFFLVAGALSYSCGTRLLPRLRGVLHTLPLPGVGFCVAALAITGVPPFNGFFSKFPRFAAGFALSVEYWILLPAMILLMIELVASFAVYSLVWSRRAWQTERGRRRCRTAARINAPGVDCTDCDVADFQRNRRDLVAVRR